MPPRILPYTSCVYTRLLNTIAGLLQNYRGVLTPEAQKDFLATRLGGSYHQDAIKLVYDKIITGDVYDQEINWIKDLPWLYQEQKQILYAAAFSSFTTLTYITATYYWYNYLGGNSSIAKITENFGIKLKALKYGASLGDALRFTNHYQVEALKLGASAEGVLNLEIDCCEAETLVTILLDEYAAGDW